MLNILKKRINNKLEYFGICNVCHKTRSLSITAYHNIKSGLNSGKCKVCARKGILHTEERRRKAELNKTRYYSTCEFCNTKRELSATAYSNIRNGRNSGLCKPCSLKGKKRPECTGPNHHNWKGGLSPLNVKIRTCATYDNWRTKVFMKDFYTCQDCDADRGGNLHAHHMVHFSNILSRHNINSLELALECSELWDIDNGITLCEDCHKTRHGLIGTKDKAPDFYA